MKISLIAMVLLCLTTTISFAQEEAATKKSQFGISMGLNFSEASIKTSDPLPLFYNSVETKGRPGFSLGILYRYRLSDLLVLRAQGVISFTSHEFQYESDPFNDFSRNQEKVNLEFPLHLVFEKADKQIAPSVFVGCRYRYDVATEKDAPSAGSPEIPFFREDDILVDVGLGVAFKMKTFTLKPELTYSRGVLNQAAEIDPVFDRMYTNQYSFRVSFYGGI